MLRAKLVHPFDAALEVERRVQVEKAKALEKYGETALLPGGNPDKDVTDYALNEIVGLLRYADMIRARAQVMIGASVLTGDNRFRAEDLGYRGKALASEIHAQAMILADHLADYRICLFDAGLLTGEPEQR